MSNPDTIILDNANFSHEVLESKLPVLVDFWAPWCGPCRALAPTIHSLATDLSGQAKIGQVDVDENPDLAAEYGVQSIPTLVFFKDGKQVDRIVGHAQREALESMLRALAGVA